MLRLVDDDELLAAEIDGLVGTTDIDPINIHAHRLQ